MNATCSDSSLLSDEACAVMRAAGLIDDEGDLLRAPVAGAIAEGFMSTTHLLKRVA